MRAPLTLFSTYITSVTCFSMLRECTTEEDGKCRKPEAESDVQVCASGYWQSIPRGTFQCLDGSMVPSASQASPSPIREDQLDCPLPSASNLPPDTSDSSDTLDVSPISDPSDTSHAGSTGNSVCCKTSVPVHEDGHGIASYAKGGKMASVYIASQLAAFRCDIDPPDDGLYVAVWTRSNGDETSQPKPANCGDTIHLTNPRTGVSSDAIVIDRCQSCVGVDYQASDSSTPDNLVNGATVDLSVYLWNKLYDGAPYSVYDISYDGPVHIGSHDGPPDELKDPMCKAEPCPAKAA